MTAFYLMYVGSVRKGFKLEGITVENDGEELYNTGMITVNNDIYAMLVAFAIESYRNYMKNK